MVRSNGPYPCKWISLYSNSSAFIFALHWSSDGLLSLNIVLKDIPICCKFSSNENIFVRPRGLWSKIFYVCSSSFLYDRRWRNLLTKQFSCKISDPWNPLNSLQHLKISTKVEAAPPGICMGLCAPIQNLRSIRRQNCLFFSFDCACFSTWSWWCWFPVRHIFLHALPLSPWIF